MSTEIPRRKPPKKTAAYSLSGDHIALIKKLAVKNDISQSAVLEYIIDYFIEREIDKLSKNNL